MTRTAFADFCAEQDARNTIELNVKKYTLMLCDALRQDYIRYSIDQHQRSIENLNYTYETTDSVQSQYHQKCIEDLKNSVCDYDFTVESGRKYHKIIMNAAGSNSVHCFIDKKTGGVFKSASWRSPAKGERYNLLLIKDREWLLENATWHGSYLYAK